MRLCVCMQCSQWWCCKECMDIVSLSCLLAILYMYIVVLASLQPVLLTLVVLASLQPVLLTRIVLPALTCLCYHPYSFISSSLPLSPSLPFPFPLPFHHSLPPSLPHSLPLSLLFSLPLSLPPPTPSQVLPQPSLGWGSIPTSGGRSVSVEMCTLGQPHRSPYPLAW